MTHYIKPEIDDRSADLAHAIGLDDEALLDHHIEEMLDALSDLELLRLHGTVE